MPGVILSSGDRGGRDYTKKNAQVSVCLPARGRWEHELGAGAHKNIMDHRAVLLLLLHKERK